MNFEKEYLRLFKPVLSYIRGRINIPGAAEDISSRVWQKAWDKRASFNPSKGLPEQWIFTIARNEVNKFFNIWRIKCFFCLGEKEDQCISAERTPFERLEQSEQNRILLQALGTLSARERDLVSLKFYSGLTNRQIAGLTGLSESNVGTIVNRALRKLRIRLEEV